VVLVAVLVATGLAMYHLSTKDFWYDETFSIDVARLAPADLLDTLLRREANGTVHYLALAVWRLLGETEARIRFLSVLCVVATIPLLYLVGRRHVGAAAAAVGCLLFAIHPFVITYAQDGRMYAMAMLIVTAAVLAWSHASATDRRAAWAAYAALGIVALYTHFFCGFVLLGLGITWLLGAVRRTRRGVVAQGAIAAAGLLLVPLIATTGFGQVSWIRPFSEAGVAAVLGIAGAGTVALAAVVYGSAALAIPTRDPARLRRVAPLVAWWVTPFAAGIGVENAARGEPSASRKMARSLLRPWILTRFAPPSSRRTCRANWAIVSGLRRSSSPSNRSASKRASSKVCASCLSEEASSSAIAATPA
jgi:4-amino-4-deoxy-L-arabinose transferase-like glycosyltransferase